MLPLIALNFTSSVPVSRLTQTVVKRSFCCVSLYFQRTPVSLDVMRTTQGEGCCRLSACESAGWHCFVLQLPKCSPIPSMRRHLRCPDQVLQPFSEAEARGISGLLGALLSPPPCSLLLIHQGFTCVRPVLSPAFCHLILSTCLLPGPGSPLWDCSTVALPINNRPTLCPLSGLSWSVRDSVLTHSF